MFKVKVLDSAPVEINTAGGKTFRKQDVDYMIPGQRHPVAGSIMVPRTGPYPPGDYEIDPSSFEVNRFGGLELGFLSLKPVRAVKSA